MIDLKGQMVKLMRQIPPEASCTRQCSMLLVPWVMWRGVYWADLSLVNPNRAQLLLVAQNCSFANRNHESSIHTYEVWLYACFLGKIENLPRVYS